MFSSSILLRAGRFSTSIQGTIVSLSKARRPSLPLDLTGFLPLLNQLRGLSTPLSTNKPRAEDCLPEVSLPSPFGCGNRARLGHGVEFISIGGTAPSSLSANRVQ